MQVFAFSSHSSLTLIIQCKVSFSSSFQKLLGGWSRGLYVLQYEYECRSSSLVISVKQMIVSCSQHSEINCATVSNKELVF